MKKIFAFMKTALVAAVGLSLFACSVDGSKDDAVAKDCGSVKFSIAIPKFMVPDTDTNARMVMPCTKVIKFYIYDSSENAEDDTHLVYKKEFSVGNSDISYSELSEDYNYISVELDDVPTGNYEADSMLIALYDSKENMLSYAYNTTEVEVVSGEDAETVTFYALPDETSEIDTDEDGWNVSTEGVAQNLEISQPVTVDASGLESYDIYFQVYKIHIPEFYGLDVTLKAKNELQKEVAIVVYDEEGVASSEEIAVFSDSSFNNKNFASIPMVYSESIRYVVIYTKGPLSPLDGNEDAEIVFKLTEENE